MEFLGENFFEKKFSPRTSFLLNIPVQTDADGGEGDDVGDDAREGHVEDAVDQPKELGRDGEETDVQRSGTPETDDRAAGAGHGKETERSFPGHQAGTDRQGDEEVEPQTGRRPFLSLL